jgi:hypothetical protein
VLGRETTNVGNGVAVFVVKRNHQRARFAHKHWTATDKNFIWFLTGDCKAKEAKPELSLATVILILDEHGSMRTRGKFPTSTQGCFTRASKSTNPACRISQRLIN